MARLKSAWQNVISWSHDNISNALRIHGFIKLNFFNNRNIIWPFLCAVTIVLRLRHCQSLLTCHYNMEMLSILLTLCKGNQLITRPQFYQTRSASSMDQGSTKKRSAVHNFVPTVTKFCVMWEGLSLPPDTKFGNCRDEIVDRRVIFIWSLIHGSSWSGLIKVGPGDSPA